MVRAANRKFGVEEVPGGQAVVALGFQQNGCEKRVVPSGAHEERARPDPELGTFPPPLDPHFLVRLKRSRRAQRPSVSACASVASTAPAATA